MVFIQFQTSFAVIQTSQGLASYTLASFLDERPDAVSVNGLLYSNNALQNCSVESMTYAWQTDPNRYTWEVSFVRAETLLTSLLRFRSVA
jgi:hypothetical protein